MDNKNITKKCERCGTEIRVPDEYTENSNILHACQVPCPEHCKTHTYDSIHKKWWR